jgi:hypothetical protein
MSLWVLGAPLVAGIACSLLSGEIKGRLGRAARDGLRNAVALLPETEASDHVETWEAHLLELADEPIGAYMYSKRVLFVAIRIRAANYVQRRLRNTSTQLASGRCIVCGDRCPWSSINCHHIVPAGLRCTTGFANVSVVCSGCNRSIQAAL